jgi:hypothetical protein
LLVSTTYKVQAGLLDGSAILSVVRGDSKGTRGWRSQYYADKEPAISLMLEANRPGACFWTFFGFEQDVVQIEAETFKLLSPELGISIKLQSLAPT